MEPGEIETITDLIKEAERLCEKLRTAVAENKGLGSEARVEMAALRRHIRRVREQVSRNVRIGDQFSSEPV